MSKRIELEYPEVGITVFASLLDKDEAEASEKLWKLINKPLKAALYHTLSTGDYYSGKPRPPKEPVRVGTQANPFGNKRVLLSDLEHGDILFTGMDLGFCYGKTTEPLMGRGPVVARVEKDYLDDFYKAGKHVWNAQYMTHKQVTVIVRRKED